MKGTFTLQTIITVIFLAIGSSLNAQTITVTNTANAGAGSLRQAVLDATAGTTILFDVATNATPVMLSAEIMVDKDLTIVGNGQAETTINGSGTNRIFHVMNSANVTLVNLTLTNGHTIAHGGALTAVNSIVTLNNCTVSSNMSVGNSSGEGGGGLYVVGGTLTVNACTITGNGATGMSGSGGGILVGTGATLTVNASTISNNTAMRAGGGIEGNSGAGTMITLNGVTLQGNSTGSNPGNGGGLHITGAGNTTINGGTVSMNTAAAEGGGLWNGTGTMTIDSTVITDNTASGNAADQGGGGIYNLNGGTLTIMSATISDNVANGTLGSGGGILNDLGAMLTVTGTEISGNTAVRAGGGVEDNSGSSTLMFTNCELMNNSVTGPPGNGGGLHITGGGNATFTGGTVSGNTAALQGGGLWIGSGTLTLDGVTVADNTADGDAATDGGGGIFNVSGTMNITNSTISGNMATGLSGSGGGIFSGTGIATISSSSITDNSANRAGGGIEVIAGVYTINDADITGNDVDGGAGVPNPGNGGGVHISGASTFVVNEGVVNDNNARREGGGLWNQTGSTMIVNYVTLDGNRASGPAEDDGGGAIFNNGGALTVNGSTLSNNSANGLLGTGGAIHVNAGTANIMLSTISGNTTLSSGGGIYNNADMTLNANTITLNTAVTSGGGIYNNSTTGGSLKNTIVSGNLAVVSGADIFSDDVALTSNGYNFIGISNDDFTSNANDITGTEASPMDASLMPLADNGGINFTHALDCPSPAADMGDMADTFNDQAGQAVFNGRRDIGAFEVQEICSLGTENFTSSLKSIVYPNPTVNGLVNIQFSENHTGGAYVSIYEMATGKLLQSAEANEMSLQLNVANYAAGTYIVKIVSGSATENHKLMINR